MTGQIAVLAATCPCELHGERKGEHRLLRDELLCHSWLPPLLGGTQQYGQESACSTNIQGIFGEYAAKMFKFVLQCQLLGSLQMHTHKWHRDKHLKLSRKHPENALKIPKFILLCSSVRSFSLGCFWVCPLDPSKLRLQMLLNQHLSVQFLVTHPILSSHLRIHSWIVAGSEQGAGIAKKVV